MIAYDYILNKEYYFHKVHGDHQIRAHKMFPNDKFNANAEQYKSYGIKYFQNISFSELNYYTKHNDKILLSIRWIKQIQIFLRNNLHYILSDVRNAVTHYTPCTFTSATVWSICSKIATFHIFCWQQLGLPVSSIGK